MNSQDNQTPDISPPSEHDAALDYLYGMLEGEKKAQFEAHLATCGRCQGELESFGRVRTVAKSTLSHVEPGERLTGALNAQLMHAATQRAGASNDRGKILLFVRRIVRHPGYAAAAGLLIIGGAVGWQWSRGQLAMPGVSASKAADPSTVAAVAAAPAPAPADEPQAGAAAAEDKAPAAPVAKPQAQIAVTAAEKQPSTTPPVLGEPMGAKGAMDSKLSNAEEATKTRAADAFADAPSKNGPAKKLARSREDSLDGLFNDSEGSGGGLGGVGTSTMMKSKASGSGSAAHASGGRQAYDGDANAPGNVQSNGYAARKDAPPVVVAPQPSSPPFADYRRAETGTRPERPQQAPQRSNRENALAEAPATVATGDEAKPQERLQDNVSKSEAAKETKRDRGGADDQVPSDRERANALAQQGRCDEATVIYQSIEKRTPEQLNAQDRLTYARCLRVVGRLDPAQGELNQLRSQKNTLPKTSIEAEQQAIDLDRMRNVEASQNSKRAAKSRKSNAASPADSAPAAASKRRE